MDKVNENEEKIEELKILVETAKKVKEQIWQDIKAERVPYKEGLLSLTPFIFGIRELNEKIQKLSEG